MVRGIEKSVVHLITNHLGYTVLQHRIRCPGAPSFCKECNDKMFPRMGETRAWHWAHYPRAHDRKCGNWVESNWHLSWKDTYTTLSSNWKVEYRVLGGRYIIDAANPHVRNRDGSIGCYREFVHSLSLYYLEKHRVLKAHGFNNILWIFDGEEFLAKPQPVGPKHFQNLVITRALDLIAELGFEHAKVHYRGKFWKLFSSKDQGGLWFPVVGDHTDQMLTWYGEAATSRAERNRQEIELAKKLGIIEEPLEDK